MNRATHRWARSIRNGFALALATALVVPTTADANPSKTRSSAKKPATKQRGAAPKPPTNPDRVRIASVKLDPPIARPGGRVQVTLTVVNDGSEPITNLDWRVTPAGARVLKGRIPRLAGKKKKVITAVFRAPASGAGRVVASVDPNRRVGEPTAARKNNSVEGRVPIISPTASKWGDWATQAATEARALIKNISGIHTCTKSSTISGPTLHFTIRLNPTQAPPEHRLALRQKGIPDPVARAFTSTVYDAYATWAKHYSAVFNNAYPTFGNARGPKALATPNQPFPVLVGDSPKGRSAFRADTLKKVVRNRLGPKANETGASVAIDAFATSVANHFAIWKQTTLVLGLIGHGNVPAFAPPDVLYGHVIGQVQPTCRMFVGR